MLADSSQKSLSNIENIEQSCRVLVVDDTPTNVFILSKLLTKAGYQVFTAEGGAIAVELARTCQPSVILLDIMMPDVNGYEVCSQLRSDSATADVPIIFLSALNAPFDKVQAFRKGAADYVTKPFQSEEVLARVRYQIELHRARSQQQHLHQVLEERVRERTKLLALAHDQLLEIALTDRLTHLPNRLAFVKQLSRVMAQAPLTERPFFAVLFLDCDRFKRVNDSLGHYVGDQLLKGVARRLNMLSSKNVTVDMVARFGGDEFALLLTEVANRSAVADAAEALADLLSQPFWLAGQDIVIQASIGMVWGEPTYAAAEHLLRDADVAMYQAKACAHRQYRWFESDMHHRAVRLLQLETDMRLALDRQEFELHYQPIVDLTRMKVAGFEALVRWQHPTKGLIAPSEFIRFAEESGLIVELGTQIFRMACSQLAVWEKAGVIGAHMRLSINIAPEQLLHPDILMQIGSIIRETGVSPHLIRLELTEGSIISDRVTVNEVLKAFKRQHMQISIDDFGTGYSALNYLHTLPVDCLKIDRSFVQPIDYEASSLGIVPLIISMAGTMGMEIIAEGIENIIQLRQLQKLGCRLGQGFLFQKAMTAEQAGMLLTQPLDAWINLISA